MTDIGMSVSYPNWLKQILGTLKTIYLHTIVKPWPDILAEITGGTKKSVLLWGNQQKRQ